MASWLHPSAAAERPARIAGLLLVAFLALAACDSLTSRPPVATLAPSASPVARATATATPAPPRIVWSSCGRGFQCGLMRAPKDYDDPAAGVLEVSLVRRPARDADRRIGALLVNPGGPGGSGVDLVREGTRLFPRNLLDRFDLIGFDPRGVNTSTAVRCIDNLDPRAQLDPSPDNAAELKALADDARTYAQACAKRNADLLPYLSTDAVVDDLERIRQALGGDKLNYLGFSYGTLIGALYADRYPENIRAFVLDAAVDPALDLVGLRTGQAKAFDAALDRFLADCAKRDDCLFNHGSGTARAFDRLMGDIEENPLPAPRTNDDRKVGPGLAWSAVLGSMYVENGRVALEAALALAEQGDGSLLLLLSDPYRGRNEDGTYSNLIDAYTSNICLDYEAPKKVEDFQAFAERLRPISPRFAGMIAFNDLACAYWPTPATRKPAPVTAKGAPPIVVVGTTGDPATPYEWSVDLAKSLESGLLVTREGEGHAATGVNNCVRRAITSFLIELKAPKDGLSCS
jgi:pimeloyl-ACP methyl ester carboxylesterase